MGLGPMFSGVATKQRPLFGHASEIPRCYFRVWKLSVKSEFRGADFEVGNNNQIIRENNDHSLLELRALQEFRIYVICRTSFSC